MGRKSIKQANLRLKVDGIRETAENFMPMVEFFTNQLTEIKPDVWGITEPYRDPFNIDDIRTKMLSWHPSDAGRWNFNWKKKSKPKAWGGFKRLYWGGGISHAEQFMYVDIEQGFDLRLTEYMKIASQQFCTHYGYFDCMTDDYLPYSELCGSGIRGLGVAIGTHKLLKNLPDILWSQVFGPPYVRLFGLEKLLSAPAYKVEQLGPEMVYIQLSESLFDMHERYEEVDAVRQRVKVHLDNNIFFRPENPEGHVYRTPDFQFPPKPAQDKSI